MQNLKVISIPKVSHRNAVAAGISTEEMWAGETGESANIIWDAETADLPDAVHVKVREMLIYADQRQEQLAAEGVTYQLYYFRKCDLVAGDHRDDSDAGLATEV